jgi:protein SCO1/2
LAGCGHSAPPVLGTVPPFALTERSGRTVGTTDLRGHVWIADFVFTRCPDFCPLLTARMAELQRSLPAGDDLRLVSVSVDPVHDTPEVLRAYAARTGAGDAWLFLTGPRDDVARLVHDGFKLAFADNGPPGQPITHSDRFVLVDRGLRIRGYYLATDAADLARLRADAATVRDERAS